MPTVLYIEDIPDMINLVRLIVTRRGYRFLGAKGGVEGLSIAREEIPDLILLDLMMEDLNGWQVLEALRGDPHTRAIPVIIVTARTHLDDRLIAMQRDGQDDYLVKPFDPTQLLERIERVIAPPTE